MNPSDVIACGAPTNIELCADCIDSYRNGIEPGESACEARMALLSIQGTACAETVLNGHEFFSPERDRQERIARLSTDPEAPVPGTWTNVTDNDFFAA